MSYGKRLQQAIELAETDRATLARAMGVSVQSIGQTINGGTKAHTAENAAKAAQALRVDLYWLATGEGVPRPAQQVHWPFETVPLADFEALPEKQKGIVEAALLQAIKDAQKRAAKTAKVLHAISRPAVPDSRVEQHYKPLPPGEAEAAARRARNSTVEEEEDALAKATYRPTPNRVTPRKRG